MRIALAKKKEILREIMSDLYGATRKRLSASKRQIAERNRTYYMEPLLPAIRLLPYSLVQHDNTYEVQVIFNQGDPVVENRFEESWSCKVPDGEPSPNLPSTWDTDYWGHESMKLDPRLYEEVAELIKEIQSLKAEEESMKNFLQQTINTYNTVKQFRAAWPESLHKYLPVPSPKKPRVKKEKLCVVAEPTITVPDALNVRMATNLLQGQ